MRARFHFGMLCVAAALVLVPASATEYSAEAELGPAPPEAMDVADARLRRKLHGSPPLFTHPPTAIENVSEIRPLGNINGVDHFIPVDHMYLRFPHGPTGGADAVPVHAMAAGQLVMLTREMGSGVPGSDYGIYLRHTPTVACQYEHIHELAARISAHVESAGTGWVAIAPGFEIMFLGQLGAPGPLAVSAGEIVGETRSYSEYWDLGIIDAGAWGSFAGGPTRRYPTVLEFAVLLGLTLDQAPYAGQETLNAGCFLNYLIPSLRGPWSALLANAPQSCGRAGWDVDGRLRGTWFNPAVDTAEPPPLFDLEWAAFSISPYNLAPASQVQIGIPSGHALAAIDPSGAYPQLVRRFLVRIGPSLSPRVNPDPAVVGPETGTVCYDLRYDSGAGERFNALLLRLIGPRTLNIAYDPTPSTASRCTALLAAGVTTWTTTYVR